MTVNGDETGCVTRERIPFFYKKSRMLKYLPEMRYHRGMSAERHTGHIAAWITRMDEPPAPGYDEAVRRDLVEAERQIAAGQGIPAEQVWEELGIE